MCVFRQRERRGAEREKYQLVAHQDQTGHNLGMCLSHFARTPNSPTETSIKTLVQSTVLLSALRPVLCFPYVVLHGVISSGCWEYQTVKLLVSGDTLKLASLYLTSCLVMCLEQLNPLDFSIILRGISKYLVTNVVKA